MCEFKGRNGARARFVTLWGKVAIRENRSCSGIEWWGI